MPKPNDNNGNGNGKYANDPITGKFLPGNPGGPGNPWARAVGEHRRAMLNAVTPEETRAVMVKLLDCALKGKAWAVREYLDRVVGKVKETVAIEGSTGVEELRAAMAALLQQPAVVRALQTAALRK